MLHYLKYVFTATLLTTLSPLAIAQQQTYTVSTADITNPERGFYEPTYAYLGAQTPSTPYTRLSQNLNLTQFGPLSSRKISVVQRLISLKNYTITDTLPDAFLQNIRTDFADARALNVKLYLRFAYDFEGTIPSVPLARIVSHISQLGPLLTDNSELITHIDAGMLGAYGEWYAGFPEPPGTQDLRTAVVNAWLTALPADRAVDIRTPRYKRVMFGNAPISSGFDGTPAARVGHHNDCFLRSVADSGTFAEQDFALRTEEKAYLSAENKFLPQSGETCGLFEVFSWEVCGPGENCSNLTSCANAEIAMRAQRWSLLNTRYFDPLVLPPNGQWHQGSNCYADFKKQLGYRIELIRSSIPTAAQVGVCGWNASVTLRNSGFASPFNPRGLKLVLAPTNGSAATFVDLLQQNSPTHDPRRWLPVADSGEIVVTLGTQLPNVTPGAYALHLFMPDGHPDLAAVPQYAIQTANVGLWDATRGWNSLNRTVQVSACITYSVGGTVSGLASGNNIALQLNSGSSFVVANNGPFTFPSALPSGASFSAIIETQPAGQYCTVRNGNGTVGTTNIGNVAVQCVDQSEIIFFDGFE